MHRIMQAAAAAAGSSWPSSLHPESLRRLDIDTPYLSCDLDVVRERFSRLERHMPFANTYYAVKCNSTAPVLRCLADLGSRFEVASLFEIELLQKLGVHASDCLFGNPIKPDVHIERAYELGVRRFVFDSASELHKIAQNAPGSQVVARLQVDNSYSIFPLSGKFGVGTREAAELLRLARNLGLQPHGASFHVGSQCLSPKAWQLAIGVVGSLMADLARDAVYLEMLDLGGGYPARYTTSVPSMAEIGTAVSAALRALPYRPGEIAVEPGRFMVAESAVLATKIIGKAVRNGTNWLYTDVGVYNGLMETAQGAGRWMHPIRTSRTDHAAAPRMPFTIAGPSCDSSDVMFRDVGLPETIDVGDRVFIGSAGAYTLSYASSFNGFPPPEPVFFGDSYVSHDLDAVTRHVDLDDLVDV